MLYRYSAAELSRMLQRREISAEELMRSIQERMGSHENIIGAYLSVNENALAQAKEIDTRRAKGETLHPLAGIPIAVKDNICTRELPTTCASQMLSKYRSPFDATVVERICRAGMIITGKTNLDEFAMGSSTETSCFKRTHNPWNLQRVPGGSSGGSAAALSAGETILALGSDTGGSVRQPASFCGVVGLLPTYGRVSRHGLVAFASSLDQIGPMARSVEDCAMLFSVISGGDARDATCVRIPPMEYTFHTNVRGMTIGVPEEYFGEGTDPYVAESVKKALALLEAQGAKLTSISLPASRNAVSAYYVLSSAEASSNLGRYSGVRFGYRSENERDLTAMYSCTRSEGFGEEVRRRILLGAYVLSAGCREQFYQRAQTARNQIRAELEETFHRCDLIAMPTAPQCAGYFGENAKHPVARYRADLCTVTANLAGLPAISVPCGTTPDGLPVGLQLMGRAFDEAALFTAAHAYECAVGRFPMPEEVAE